VKRLLGAVALAASLASCRPAAPGGLTLLFLRRSPAALLDGNSWAPDPDSARLVAFDGALSVVRVLTAPELETPMAVAAWRGRLVASEFMGTGVSLDTAGHVTGEWPSPFPAGVYAAAGDKLFAARSPYYVQPLATESLTAPLVLALDSAGRPAGGLATIHVPPTPFLIQPTNAGALAADSGGDFYFAPLARDQIVKYDRAGRVRWTTKRGLYPRETDPNFLPAAGRRLPLQLAIVNVAMVLGPAGRLYVLGSQDSAGDRLRVDVLDTATGTILDTRRLGPNETAVAADPTGALETFNAESLLARVRSRPREAFGPAFALPDLAGDTVRLSRFAGKVTLVNFWASWCDPCREEFPHMATLYRQFPRDDFEIVAISDDVDRAKMEAFVRRFAPPFAILVGAGRMKDAYHYRGLPYSVLLDRRGRIVERIFGFGGAEEFQALRATIAKEIGGS